MIHATYPRDDALCTIGEIAVPASKIGKIRRILSLHAVPQMGPDGGHGWQLTEGGIAVIGSHSAVVKVMTAIEKVLNGGVFRDGWEIYLEQKQGAMP